MKKLFALCFSLFCLVFGMTGVNKAQATFASDAETAVVKRVTREPTTPDEKYQNIINQMNSIITAAFGYDSLYKTAEETKAAMTGLNSLAEQAGDLLLETWNCYEETSEERFRTLYDDVSNVHSFVANKIDETRENFINYDYYNKCFDFKFLDGCVDQISRTYDIEVAALNSNKSTTELILSTFNSMSSNIENAVSLLGEDERYTYLLSVLDEEIELVTDLLGDINELIAIEELKNKSNELIEQYNKIKSSYQTEVNKSKEYTDELDSILEKINSLKEEILAKMDEFGTLPEFDTINQGLTDLRVNCNDLIKDIKKNKVNIVLNEGSLLDTRVNEIANNYKTNNLNYDGDIKECEDLATKIDSLIAKIDEDSSLNSDDQIKELRSKLNGYKETVSQTKKNIEKNHTVFLVLVIGCPIVFVVAVFMLLYFFGFKKRFLRKTTK